MKISISYPPLDSEKGVPLLSQNRQFQWFNSPTYIYPVIPACAATLLKKNGYDVMWDDGIAEELTYQEWEERIIQEKPDIIAIETKTPVVKKHWALINDFKEKTENIAGWNPVVVLMGDHVTALPGESFEHCKVDYIIASGDYDFALLSLANHLNKKEELEGGFWYRDKKGEVVCTGPANIMAHNLDDLPIID
ncbi:MAG: B12-binding domain-containing radical SAM protein, partial [bacterium]